MRVLIRLTLLMMLVLLIKPTHSQEQQDSLSQTHSKSISLITDDEGHIYYVVPEELADNLLKITIQNDTRAEKLFVTHSRYLETKKAVVLSQNIAKARGVMNEKLLLRNNKLVEEKVSYKKKNEDLNLKLLKVKNRKNIFLCVSLGFAVFEITKGLSK